MKDESTFFIYKYQLILIFLFKILVVAKDNSFSKFCMVDPSSVTDTGGKPGNGWACVIKNLTIILINSSNSSPLTIEDVFGSISSTILSLDIPYKVLFKSIFVLLGEVFVSCANK